MKVVTLSTVKRGGVRHPPGDELDLPTAEALALIDCGAAAQALPATQAEGPAPAAAPKAPSRAKTKA